MTRRICLLIVIALTAGCATKDLSPRPGDRLSSQQATAWAQSTGSICDDQTAWPTFQFVEQGYAAEMFYRQYEPTAAANGETVVLLHGKNFAGYYWEKTAKDLAARGYRVIVPDQLGFGNSAKITELQYGFHQMARNTAALLDHLKGGPVHVVGHSMGGMLATRFSLLYPDRVSTLTLVNPIGLEDYRAHGFNRSVDDWTQRELKQNYDSMKAYQRQNYYNGGWPDGAEEFVVTAANATESPEWPTIARVSAKLYDVIITQPVVYEFKDLRVPTTLIIGQRDRTYVGKDALPPEIAKTVGDYPALSRTTAEKIPGAKLVSIDNAGHMPMVETYDVFVAALVKSFGPAK